MVQVYGTFANRGRRPEFHYLDRIETADGRVLVEFNRPNPRRFPRVLREDHADMMIKMLESVVDSGTARRLKYEFRLYNDIAGKTGTTQDQTDGWFLGFSPRLVAGAWVGADDPNIRFRSMRLGQGSKTALPIWGRFMRKVYDDPELKNLRYGKFSPPNDTSWALMQCPPILDEMPIVAGMQDEYQEDPAFFNRLYSDLADYRDQEINVQLKKRRPNESEAEYYERMRRYNERLMRRDDRREKLKKLWSEVLFGKKEEDQ
jgi:penicillin-binding protein 1A